MVAPHNQVLDRADGLRRLLRELRQRPIVVEPHHRSEIFLCQRGRRLHRDVGVGVRRVSDDEHLDVPACDGIERFPLLDENPGVLQEQILALHPGSARTGTHQQRHVGILEGRLGVGSSAHPGEEAERAVLDFHHHALERGLRLVDGKLEQLQDHRLIATEHLTVGDSEQQAVADLTGSAGDRNADGAFHGLLLGGDHRRF